MSAPTWLLEVTVGGAVLRYATRRVEVTDARGRVLLYRAGLADFDLLIDGAEESQGFEILDPMVDWALIATRENTERAPVVLRFWEVGEQLEDAAVVLRGLVTEPEYGDPESPNTFVGTIQTGTAGVDRSWPAVAERVDTSTWERDPSGTTYDEGIEGAVYPTVFGYPGEGDVPTTTPRCCVPAPLVDWNNGAIYVRRLLLGRGKLNAVGGVIFVCDVDDEMSGMGIAYEDQAVITDTDDLGQTVTLAEVPPGAGVQGELGHAYYVGYSSIAGRGGGSLRTDSITQPMRTLADVARFCLQNSGRAVDLEAQDGERSRLENYRIDGYINEELQLIPWFEGNLMPMFPIERAMTQTGMYWRFVNWWATERDAVAHLDADKGQVRRASSIRVYDDQVVNYFTIEFQFSQGTAGARRMLSGEGGKPLPWFQRPGGTPLDDRVLPSPALVLSQSIYGVREAPVHSTEFLWSETTAAAVLHYWAVRDSFPRRPVLYEGRARQLRELRRGDIVTVTDSRVHLSRAVARVDGVRLRSSESATAELSLLDPKRLG